MLPFRNGEMLVAVRGISKRFGPTVALDDVSITGRGGSIHAITGENGAGKSTLMKLLAGVHQPDHGHLVIDGEAQHFQGPAAARAAGVSTVFQELTVLPNLTVCENLLLGREPRRMGMLDRAAMLREALAVLARIGIDIDARRACGSLTVGEQQLVEIAKGVATDARIFIFDEPSAALNRAEVDKLESLIAALKAQGKLVFYISHRLDEILRLCDTVTVLKDGRLVTTEPAKGLTTERLVALMVGRPLQALFPAREAAAAGNIALDVRALTQLADGPTARFWLRHGEIVGLGGLEGQGQREIMRALAGAQRPFASDIRRTDARGETASYDPRDGVVRAVEQGIGLIPEDRKLEGLYLQLPIADNIGLGPLRGMGLMRRARRDQGAAGRIAQRMRLRARDLAQQVSALSGGNQQKVMLGRWLAAGVDTLLVEQPTRGVDMGAKAEIYALLREFARSGGAVLAVSSDLPELIGLCDRILMVDGGRIVGDVDAALATEEGLLALALAGDAETVSA
ncbi:MAG: sugar ABC transporter ATP-binding protein [Hyphomicrobiales bacterium]|nr:MAG: sugar ABC transporter ATP-binding protein [Hyphomicrobiales bacterium]